MSVLVTGSAGFIGFHVAKKLLESGETVIGIDNFNAYYEVSLKEARNSILERFPNFILHRGDVTDKALLEVIFKKNTINSVLHFAAQVGIRESNKNKEEYIKSNIVGFNTVIEASRQAGVKKFLYASSSSVYGSTQQLPFHEDDPLTTPRLSLYAETKRANEVIASCYNSISEMRSTGLRFFTVYGPWGRPDMALFLFTKKIIQGEPIEIFGDGSAMRDFTYIDDVAAGIISFLDVKDSHCDVLNLGRSESVALVDCIHLIEKHTGVPAKTRELHARTEEALKTHADITRARIMINYDPKISLSEGVRMFVDWYKDYYKI